LVKKLTFWSRGRPLLKNPCNTGRASTLHQLFPGAQFIHISRHPYDTYRSNMHLARHAHVMNQLQDPDSHNSYEDGFLDNYRRMEERYYETADQLAAQSVAETRYEDLKRDPIGEIQRIYEQLGLELTPRYLTRLQRYVGNLKGYQPNRYKPLDEIDRHKIERQMGSLMERWRYASDPHPEAEHQAEPARRAA
jgi:hypothetical protein